MDDRLYELGSSPSPFRSDKQVTHPILKMSLNYADPGRIKVHQLQAKQVH